MTTDVRFPAAPGRRMDLIDALAAVDALFTRSPYEMPWPSWCRQVRDAAFRVQCANGGALCGTGRADALPLFAALETWTRRLSNQVAYLEAVELHHRHGWRSDAELWTAVVAVRELWETRPYA